MRLRDEIQATLQALGADQAAEKLFSGLALKEETRQNILASLLAGHHLFLVGPPGVGKTSLAERISALLPERRVVAGCPVNCRIDNPECPWCWERIARGESLSATELSGVKRVSKVSGSAELSIADLMGDIHPQLALEYGIYDLRAFVPGKLLRANGGIFLLDFLDRFPERVLNAVLAGLSGDGISVGNYDAVFPLDFLMVATGASSALSRMPIDLTDHFDVIAFAPAEDGEWEEKLLSGGRALAPWIPAARTIVDKTRRHEDLARGISMRGVIRFGELIDSFAQVLGDDAPEKILPPASDTALPHRVKVAPHAQSQRSAREIVREIVNETLGLVPASESLVTLSKENLMALVEEIARQDHFRKPLKFGWFDLLLKRIKRFPESELARLHDQVLDRMMLKYRERDLEDNLTYELLADIDEVREKQTRLSAELRAKLEAEALIKTIDMLEERQILAKDKRGYNLSRRGIALLLEKLSPRGWESTQLSGEGKHRTGKKLQVGEGRIVGTRVWRFGDRYRDISLKDTMRQAIRNRHRKIAREDIQVIKRDIRTRLDIVLCLDLSGTMNQLEKLWYAKESAIALSLASSGYHDRVGLVTFSNLAKVVSDVTANTYRLTEKVLDLDLHENAFTNIGYGLLTARGLFARHSKGHSKQHIILVSDGDATAPHPSPGRFALHEAAKTIRSSISISCICINEENADPDLMNKIARIGRGRTTLIADTQGMREALVGEQAAAQ